MRPFLRALSELPLDERVADGWARYAAALAQNNEITRPQI